MRREVIAGIGALAVFGPSKLGAVVSDPLPAEGVELDYRWLFGGNEIGTQKVRIREHTEAGHVVIEHEIAAQVRILFAVAYSLEHRSTEVWDGFELSSVQSETIENGNTYLIAGERGPEGFRIQKSDNDAWVAPRSIISSDSFWLAAALDTPTVFNTRTGEAAVPSVEELGNGRWVLNANFDHGSIVANLQYAGDFLEAAEIDSDGHVVRIERLMA